MHADQTAQLAAFDPTPLPLRGDTMLGACEALGQDFGFNPNWLRVVLGSLVLWNPWGAFGIYLGLAAVVGVSRLLAPPRREKIGTAPRPASETIPAEDEELALAA